jgi:hypothetical protein
MYEYGTLKPIKVILRRERRKGENNGRGEPNWGTFIACIYGNVTVKPLYNYYILIKTFLKGISVDKNVKKWEYI